MTTPLWQETILAQYANSPTITALIESFSNSIDPTADINNFYSTLWNIDTCNDAGLENWGRIVNVSRYIQVTQTQVNFGFNEAFTTATANTGAQPFNQAPMYSGALATTTFRLATDAYRKLIMVKAMANITNCTAASLNSLLLYLFAGEGRAYVQDTGDMTMRFVFEFTLSAVELGIMLTSGAIPRPAGVQAIIMQVDTAHTFGFAEAGGQPFGQGTLFNSSGIQYVS